MIGAYERDNFGDLLFGIVTDAWLRKRGWHVVWTSPLPGTCDDLAGARVKPYPALFESDSLAAIWTVGGEIGAMTPAQCRALYPSDCPIPDEAIETPYMVSLGAYPAQIYTPTIINSVGLAALRSAGDDQRRRDIAALRAADFVSVRDKVSSDLLDEIGISHRLAPDVVHALPQLVDLPSISVAEPYMLFQIVSYSLPVERRQQVAEQLLEVMGQHKLGLRFFAAGVAPLHDSLRVYEDIAGRIEKMSGITPEIIQTRQPLELAAYIASSSLWVGTSLHGRVVASSFDVPRVGLPVQKLSNYAEKWDPSYPWDVELSNLAAAAEKALTHDFQGSVSSKLQSLAIENLEAATIHLSERGNDETRAQRGIRRFKLLSAASRCLERENAGLRYVDEVGVAPFRQEALRWVKMSIGLIRRGLRGAKARVSALNRCQPS